MFAFNESKELAQVQHVIFANMGILHEELSAMPPTVLDIITDGYFSTYLDLVGEDMETCTKAFGQSWK
jgi:hypothetical protein